MFLPRRLKYAAGVFAAGLVLCCALSVSAGQDIRFSDAWKFYLGDQTGAQAPAFVDASWATVYLPHTVREELNYRTASVYYGYCWYRKSFTPSTAYQGKKVYLEFEAAMQTAEVWINGTALTTHLGGYTPIVYDITGNLVFGSTNVIAVRLNNNPSSSFPPGNPSPDFLYFGGLYRNAHLHVMDNLHISNAILANTPAGGGVFAITTAASASSATVQVRTHVMNENSSSQSCVLTTSILDSNGATVATSSSAATNINAGASNTFTQTLTVSNPQRWHPNSPYLYKVRSQVYSGGGATLTDTLSTTIGIRTIAFSHSTGFSINGSRFTFRGANRHMAYPYIGNAVPNSGQYRDVQRMKEYGYNFVRMSHYTQAGSFVDACDKLGVLGMACLPGWQYSNTGAFVTNSVKALQDMIRLYRNHPSVIVYEAVWNETYSCNTTLNNAAHAEFLGTQMFTCGENANGSCPSCYDVYTSSAQHNLRNFGGGCSAPVIMAEYGDWEHGCVWANPITGCQCRIERSAGEATLLNVSSIRQNDLSLDRGLTWLAGDAIWTVFDYQSWVNGPYTASGDMDIFRIPKFSGQFMRSQRDPSVNIAGVNSGPMVFIASYWNSSSSTTVSVYSNCEQVRLYKNGTLVSTNSPITGTNLEHPRFSFSASPYAAGNLRAEGLIGGTARAWDTVYTPGTISRVKVVIDTAGLPFAADGSDIAIVYGYILGPNGEVIPTATNSVTFSVSGPGTLVGTNPVAAIAGIASILLRSGIAGGQITITGAASGAASGSDEVTSHVPPTTGISDPFTPVVVRTQPVSFAIRIKGSKLSLQVPSGAVKEGGAVFTLCNAQGRLVGTWNLTRSSTSVNIKSLPHGIYMGQITDGTGRVMQKIIW